MGTILRTSLCVRAVILAALVTGCAPREATGPMPGASLAAGGGQGGGSSPTVTTFNPKEGEQGTSLDLYVTGTGFDATSSVTLLLNGKATPRVRTNSTTLVPGSTTELVANITIASDAVVADYEVQVANAGGKKGIGIEKFAVTVRTLPHDLPALATLAGPTGGDGLFSDGGGPYPQSMETTGEMRVEAACTDGRRFVIDLPAEWSPLVATGTSNHCSGGTGNDWGLLAGVRLYPCADGASCPMGTTGHDPTSISFSPDLRYFWTVSAPKPKGKGTLVYDYDVVWVDATYRVTRWAGGVPNGTACEWAVSAASAEFWQGRPTLVKLSGVRPVSLIVSIGRIDAVCTS